MAPLTVTVSDSPSPRVAVPVIVGVVESATSASTVGAAGAVVSITSALATLVLAVFPTSSVTVAVTAYVPSAKAPRVPLVGTAAARSSSQLVAGVPVGVTSYVAPLTTTLSTSSAAKAVLVPAIVGDVEFVV